MTDEQVPEDEPEVTLEPVPEGVTQYAILKRAKRDSLIFESMNGEPVPVYTQDGVKSVFRDREGKLCFNINLVGVLGKARTVLHGDDAKVFIREHDGSLTEYHVEG